MNIRTTRVVALCLLAALAMSGCAQQKEASQPGPVANPPKVLHHTRSDLLDSLASTITLDAARQEIGYDPLLPSSGTVGNIEAIFVGDANPGSPNGQRILRVRYNSGLKLTVMAEVFDPSAGGPVGIAVAGGKSTTTTGRTWDVVTIGNRPAWTSSGDGAEVAPGVFRTRRFVRWGEGELTYHLEGTGDSLPLGSLVSKAQRIIHDR